MLDNHTRVQSSTLADFGRKHDPIIVHENLYNLLISPDVEDYYKIILEKPYIRLVHYEKSNRLRRILA